MMVSILYSLFDVCWQNTSQTPPLCRSRPARNTDLLCPPLFAFCLLCRTQHPMKPRQHRNSRARDESGAAAGVVSAGAGTTEAMDVDAGAMAAEGGGAQETNPPAAKRQKRNDAKDGDSTTTTTTDCKSSSPPPPPPSLVIEVVAGTGERGSTDGALGVCEFRQPRGLCRFGDSLIVAERGNHTLRMVEGVLGVDDPMAESKAHFDMLDYEARVVPLLMETIGVLPKELARLMAQYARHVGGRTHTIAGAWRVKDPDGGPALYCAHFNDPSHVALDATDPVAGPQLIVAEFNGRRVRCLNMRTRMVTTIAGVGLPMSEHVDGPASQAQFGCLGGIAVAPSGVLFVADVFNDCVRRISASKWPGFGAAPAERMVTTLIGQPGPHVLFAQSSAQSFRRPQYSPWPLALYAPPSPTATLGASDGQDPDRDAGRMYVGFSDEVHAFDLAKGERQHFVVTGRHYVSGLVVSEDGAWLFAVGASGVDRLDAITGACTELVSIEGDNRRSRAGPVTDDPATTGRFGHITDCIIDRATRSLVMCDFDANRIVRLRGVDL